MQNKAEDPHALMTRLLKSACIDEKFECKDEDLEYLDEELKKHNDLYGKDKASDNNESIKHKLPIFKLFLDLRLRLIRVRAQIETNNKPSVKMDIASIAEEIASNSNEIKCLLGDSALKYLEDNQDER